MPKLLEFFFDFTSPAAYLAWTQLDGLAERTGAQIVWKPMLFGAVLKEAGNKANIEVPAKAAYTIMDMKRCADHLGVPFVWPAAFPVNSVPLLRGCFVAGEDKVFHDYVPAIWRAIWVDGKNLNDIAVLHGVLGDIGLDAPAFLEKCKAEDVKETLRVHTAEAVKRGVFGAPTFFINGDEMFWGHDRLPYIERALENLS